MPPVRPRSDGLLAATAFGGFQMADIHDAGLSVVTVADGDQRKAEARLQGDPRHRLARTRKSSSTAASRWSRRSREPKRWRRQAAARFCCWITPTTVRPAPTQDTMYVLKEALRQGLTGIAVGPVRDPQAVAKMIEAGVGAKVTLKVGGKMDMPAIDARASRWS